MEIIDKSAELYLFEAIEIALDDLKKDRIIHSIEVFNSQVDFESQERPRKYPFVMIDIATTWGREEISKLNNVITNVQKGSSIITVYCVFQSLLNETKSFATCEEIRHKVHRKLQGLIQYYFFTKLMRQSSNKDTSHDRVFSYINEYTCELIEASQKRTDQTTISNLGITYDNELKVDSELIRGGLNE